MKISEHWLREFVNPPVDVQTLGDKLTALGLELEAITPVADDTVIELGLTPNRGDCFSVLGVARELSVAFGLPVQRPEIPQVEITLNEAMPIEIQAPQACPRYCGRIIRDVNIHAPTPDWMRSRIEKSGMQSVNIIVDITNYVLTELGQPMHAFDLDKIKGTVHLRMSRAEKFTLLNHSEVTLNDNTLVICDDTGVIALAGIMGGLNTETSDTTKNIFLEAAFFLPDAVMGGARRLNLHSDGAQRFERGVDPGLTDYAMDRATQLILELAGGHAGEVTEDIHGDYLPKPAHLSFAHSKLCSVLGMDVPSQKILSYFTALNMHAEEKNGVYHVTPPSYRFDMAIPEDLIEEVIRIAGYDSIPETELPAMPGPTLSETVLPLTRIKSTLIDRGYHEVITYSFVDKQWQNVLFPEQATHDLLNPISPDMGSMRLSIWPGLLKTLAYNQNRQMNDLRIFEIGQCFVGDEHPEMIAGLIAGQAHPLHWGMPKRSADFFDLKGDLEALLAHCLDHDYHFVADTHPSLAPGQTAAIQLGDKTVGWIGALHPALAKQLDVKLPVYLFELPIANLLTRALPRYQPLSKYPAIRRDLAVLVDASIHADALLEVAKQKAGPLLKQIDIFDVYQGERIEKGKKSIALGLILQDSSRTLIDEEVNDLMQAVVQGLEQTFQATVRE